MLRLFGYLHTNTHRNVCQDERSTQTTGGMK